MYLIGLWQTYNMAYDGFRKLTAVQVGTRNLAGYTYAANDGLLTQMTYGNGNTVAYDYDDLEGKGKDSCSTFSNINTARGVDLLPAPS